MTLLLDVPKLMVMILWLKITGGFLWQESRCLSLNVAVISFDLEKEKSFKQGRMYLALSRVTNINNL